MAVHPSFACLLFVCHMPIMHDMFRSALPFLLFAHKVR